MASGRVFAAGVARLTSRHLRVVEANLQAVLNDMADLLEDFGRDGEPDLDWYDQEAEQLLEWLAEHLKEWVLDTVWLAGALAYLQVSHLAQQ